MNHAAPASAPDVTQPFDDITDFRKVMKELEVAEPRRFAVPHIWKWDYIHERLTKAESFDLTQVHRRAFALCNPGLGGRTMVTPTLFASVSVYYPGDSAPVHRHTGSASRFALQAGNGGYTNVAGERFEMGRGDLVITPNGEWHDHGNDGDEPIFWVDVLDVPMVENLSAIMTEWNYTEIDPSGNSGEEVPRKAQSVTKPKDWSQTLFSKGGIVPLVGTEDRLGRRFTAKFNYKASDVREVQDALKHLPGDPYEGIMVEYTDPLSGGPVVPTLSFRSQLLRKGEATRPLRQTASTVFAVLEGEGETHLEDGQVFKWSKNDVFVVPGWFWRHHVNTGPGEAVIYSVNDSPAQKKLGLYRAQGKTAAGDIVDVARWPEF